MKNSVDPSDLLKDCVTERTGDFVGFVMGQLILFIF